MDKPDLVLESKTTAERDEITVTFSFRNRGKTDCAVILEDYYREFIPRLFDAEGKELIPWDRRATHGARAEPIGVKASPPPAGGTLEAGFISLASKRRHAYSTYQDWNLEKMSAQRLSVQFTYRITPEMAARVARKGTPGAIVGEWTSPQIDVTFDPQAESP